MSPSLEQTTIQGSSREGGGLVKLAFYLEGGE